MDGWVCVCVEGGGGAGRGPGGSGRVREGAGGCGDCWHPFQPPLMMLRFSPLEAPLRRGWPRRLPEGPFGSLLWFARTLETLLGPRRLPEGPFGSLPEGPFGSVFPPRGSFTEGVVKCITQESDGWFFFPGDAA